MPVRRFLTSSDDVAEAVRTERARLRLTQAQVGELAGVSRQFVIDVEAGHPRAEIDKVLAVLDAVQVHALALPAPAPRTDGKTMHNIDLDAQLEAYLNG